MSFAGFVFDMIRRDKENRNLRLLRRERLNERLDKMYKGHGMPRNTTAEDMEKITRLTRQKEYSEQRYTVRMMLIIMGICILLRLYWFSYLPANSIRKKRPTEILMNFPRFINKFLEIY